MLSKRCTAKPGWGLPQSHILSQSITTFTFSDMRRRHGHSRTGRSKSIRYAADSALCISPGRSAPGRRGQNLALRRALLPSGHGGSLHGSRLSGTMPSRFVMRNTWVSTGITSRPQENRSTQSAVLGPTPFIVNSSFRAASGSASQTKSRVPPYSSMTSCETCLISFAFCSCRPPILISCAISASGAFASFSGVSYFV